LFLNELCELLVGEKPRPASDKVHEADYTFERPVEFNDGEGKISTNFIDLYKRHYFVLEAKQGADKAQSPHETGRMALKPRKTGAGGAANPAAIYSSGFSCRYQPAI
jgi:hypothetical protein